MNMIKSSNTHKSEEFHNTQDGSLKRQRINDIQDAIDDKFLNADGNGDETEYEETDQQEVKQDDSVKEKISTAEQAQDVMAKTHAKKEPVMIFGVKLSYIIGGIVVIGGTIALVKYYKSVKA